MAVRLGTGGSDLIAGVVAIALATGGVLTVEAARADDDVVTDCSVSSVRTEEMAFELAELCGKDTQEMLSPDDVHNVLFAGAPSHAGRGSHLLAVRLRVGTALEQQVQRFEFVHHGALRFEPSNIVFSGPNPF